MKNLKRNPIFKSVLIIAFCLFMVLGIGSIFSTVLFYGDKYEDTNAYKEVVESKNFWASDSLNTIMQLAQEGDDVNKYIAVLDDYDKLKDLCGNVPHSTEDEGDIITDNIYGTVTLTEKYIKENFTYDYYYKEDYYDEEYYDEDDYSSYRLMTNDDGTVNIYKDEGHFFYNIVNDANDEIDKYHRIYILIGANDNIYDYSDYNYTSAIGKVRTYAKNDPKSVKPKEKTAEKKEILPIYIGDIEDTYSYQNIDKNYTNYRFTITDQNGKEIFSNVDKNEEYLTSAPVVNNMYFDDDASKHFNYDVSGYILKDLPVKDESYYLCQLYNIISWANSAVYAIIFFTLMIICGCFIAACAGYKKGEEGPVLTGIHRVPWDLFIVIAAVVFMVSFLPLAGCAGLMFERYTCIYDMPRLSDWAWFFGVIGTILFTLPFPFVIQTTAARAKVRKFNFIFWNLLKKSVKFFLPGGALGTGIGKLLRPVPMFWKFLLGFIVAVIVECILIVCIFGGFAPGLSVCLFIVYNIFLIYLLGRILQQMLVLKTAGERLAGGDLETKTATEGLMWEFKKHAENLNSISEGMAIAMTEKLKSERLKTELVTNVSHDLKTPLTSIINYVDLLKKEDIKGENTNEYIEVLDRQSLKLKKLTEDLVEASKASSGTIPVNLESVNSKELFEQALGEYRTRFEEANLEIIENIPDDLPNIEGDGRLLWRVLDNVFSNVCKYAQNGSRVYVEGEVKLGKVYYYIKNISKERLNITPDELMERFVRGDSSRTTEGSGLGLSIAQNLTKLQNGTFDIDIDGDLFKVTISFVTI